MRNSCQSVFGDLSQLESTQKIKWNSVLLDKLFIEFLLCVMHAVVKNSNMLFIFTLIPREQEEAYKLKYDTP